MSPVDFLVDGDVEESTLLIRKKLAEGNMPVDRDVA